MKKSLLLLTLIVLSTTALFAQSTLKVKGIMPDANAKTGTWTAYQMIKNDKGEDILKYKIRLKSAKKFVGSSAECIFEVEVVNLTKNYISADISYSYDQYLNGKYSSMSGDRMGFIGGGKKWNYELMAFNDKETNGTLQGACHNCGFSYEFKIKQK